MTSTNEIGLASERVQSSSDIDLGDIHCSTICENILWKPVSCQQCETHFCAKCITKWLTLNPNQCPLRCENFIQRPCSKFIVKQLSKLQIACIYQTNGCNEIVPYEVLEKHEMMCEFKLVKCPNCQSEMPQKNLSEHQQRCGSVLMTSGNCQVTCSPSAPPLFHGEIDDLRGVFEQYRAAAQFEIQQLREELRKMPNDPTGILVARGLIPEGKTVKRIQLQSTAEMETLSKRRVVLDPDSKTDVHDELVCTTCRDVVWKPVYCGQCRSIFCSKCRPQVGFFSRVSTFFGAERPRHGRRNCENFEEAPIPTSVTKDLGTLRIQCAYEQNGCRILSQYYDLERHESQCPFENIPCQICQFPLSKRKPVVSHSTRACFEEMGRKNPAAIQQQFMTLLEATERAETENRRLKSVTEELQRQINTFDSKYVKKLEKQTDKKP